MSFKVGDRVTRMVHRQRSHGGGQRAEQGVVVAVVASGIHVDIACADAGVTKPDSSSSFRDHESYIVRVGSKNYWPLVAKLRAS